LKSANKRRAYLTNDQFCLSAVSEDPIPDSWFTVPTIACPPFVTTMSAEQVSVLLHGEEGTAVNLILERGDNASAATLHTRQMLCGHHRNQDEYRSQR
jgi:hypothetical protein